MDEEGILNPTHQVDGWYDGVSLTLIDAVKNLSDKEYVDHLRAFSEDTKLTILRSERARWQTFRSYWRIDHPILAKSLAKSGFYSLNIGDEVHCIFCRKTFCNWNDGDPMKRHQEVSPKCPFVQGQAQNIPFRSWKLPIERKDDAEAQATNTDCIPSIPIPEFSDEALAEMVRDPRYPAYRLHENRLKSFAGHEDEFLISAQKLADSGMFYSNHNYQGDSRATCFCCDGCFTNWEENDDPWTEHATWYPKCPFLVDAMGAGYVQNIQAQLDPVHIDEILKSVYSGFDNRIMCCMCHQRQAKAKFEPCGDRQLCEVCYAAGIRPQNPSQCMLCNEQIQDIVLLTEPAED